jgi:hypothetical protein
MTEDLRSMTGREFLRSVGDDVDKWTDAGIAALQANGVTLDRAWLRSFLDDAMTAAREHERRRPIP